MPSGSTQVEGRLCTQPRAVQQAPQLPTGVATQFPEPESHRPSMQSPSSRSEQSASEGWLPQAPCSQVPTRHSPLTSHGSPSLSENSHVPSSKIQLPRQEEEPQRKSFASDWHTPFRQKPFTHSCRSPSSHGVPSSANPAATHSPSSHSSLGVHSSPSASQGNSSSKRHCPVASWHSPWQMPSGPHAVASGTAWQPSSSHRPSTQTPRSRSEQSSFVIHSSGTSIGGIASATSNVPRSSTISKKGQQRVTEEERILETETGCEAVSTVCLRSSLSRVQ
mmetsp:Transcript_15220/g.30850  ORF Transcript_15220/g.30850 Transcript_15220/m.30850 type:complete len:278 (-) Transcript_15220:53-886(-)